MAPVRTAPGAPAAPAAPAAPGGTRHHAPSAVGHVHDEGDAEALAARLQDPGRSWPVAVVSTARGRRRPYVDADRLLDEVRGLAEVVVIRTGEASWAFSRAMPQGTQVYGGASRVYPVGLGWVHHLDRSPLWFADDDAEGARTRERLVQDALTAAAGAGLAATTTPSAPADVRAVVLGVVGTRALVRTEEGSTAHVAQELTLPTVPVDRLLAADMTVQGVLDRASQRLDVRAMLPDATAQAALVRDAYPVDAVVPVQVQDVRADEVVLALAPEVLVRVGRAAASGGSLDDLCDLFSVGEVVAARMLDPRPVPGPAGATRPDLRLDDVDDAACVLPALSLLAGGPAWLPRPSVGAGSASSPDAPDTPDAPDAPGAPDASGRPGAGAVPPTPADLVRRGDATTSPAPPSPGPSRPDPAAPGQATPGQATPGQATPPGPAPRRSGPKPGPGLRRAVPPPGHEDPAGHAALPERAAEDPTRARHRALVNQLELTVHEQRARADAAEARVLELRAAVRGLEAETAGLRDLAREQQDRIDRLQRDVERHKRSVRIAKKERRRDVEPAPAHRRLFVDPVDQLRYDVRRTWAELVDAEEKDEYPLPEFVVGPEFCDTLAGTGRGLEEKVHRAVVLVLVGRAQDVAGYELHRLRRGDGGGDPYRVRESDGAQAMRLSLQVSSPQARRLHYWVLPGGGVELSRVVLHDDVEP
ncbi:hypothetical protein [Isoptericola aurantiacus]|uniref:hypothetical protein n=1 Tax=Isoptericola aurantiacus TaxID=3377839 RepID=UPI00383B2FAC